MKPIFILGCQRSGTTMLARLLNENADVDIMKEMHLMQPAWLHQDFVREVGRQVGDLKDDSNISPLLDLMFSGNLFGMFWKKIDLERDIIEQRILKSDRSIKGIFEILLSEHSRLVGKNRCGAKFPVHFCYIDVLREWFPDCKIVFSTRDIRGIYASQANKYFLKPLSVGTSDKLTRFKDGSRLGRAYIRFKMFVFICIQYAWAARVHTRSRHLDNYLLLRYEDIILKPEETLRGLCSFLGIDFREAMLNPNVINSTFANGQDRKGFDKSLVNRWKSIISPFTAKLLTITNRKSIKKFGY